MYKRMDSLVVFITSTEMFMIMPNQEPKIAKIEGNEQQYDIMMNCPDATKEEFEALLLTKDIWRAAFEWMYYSNTK
jgi:hypothetical protein